MTFFFVGQFCGRYGSSGPSKSTITSAVVRLCDSGWSNTGMVGRVLILLSTVSRREMVRESGSASADEPTPSCCVWERRLRVLEILACSSRG